MWRRSSSPCWTIPSPPRSPTLLATRAEQRRTRHAQDVEQLQTIASHIPEVRTVIEVLYLKDLVLALSQEVRAAAEGLARLAEKTLSRDELTLCAYVAAPNFTWSTGLRTRKIEQEPAEETTAGSKPTKSPTKIPTTTAVRHRKH